MNRKINILGVWFDHLDMAGAITRGLELLGNEEKSTVYTPNPEIVMAADKDARLQDILNQGDLVIADGIGIVIGSKIIGKPLPERVAGYDFVQRLFSEIKHTDKAVYFFGAKPGVAQQAALKMQQQHQGLCVVGVTHGYAKDSDKVVADINRRKPDIVLVGLGAPAQEKWIAEYRDRINARLFIGVGGSFDVMAGVVKRAPKLFIRLRLEWFYRLLKQPTRFRRMLQLPLFLIKMMGTGKRFKQEPVVEKK